MLINDPTGGSLHMQLEWLHRTPFENFLIPGILLFLFIGIVNAIGAYFTFRKNNRRPQPGFGSGLILMGWIISQVALIGYKDFLQPLYFMTGLIQTFFGYILMKKMNDAGKK